MRKLILAAVLAMVLPMSSRADELSDLKAQLDAAMKSIQALQQRVEALEAEKAKAAAAPPEAKPTAAPTEPKTAAASAAPEAKEAAAAPAVAEAAPVVAPNATPEQGADEPGKARLEITGKVQLDVIYDFDRMNPDWNATLRPSQIPVNCAGGPGNDPGCGAEGETIFSVRQTAIDLKGYIPTSLGELKTDLYFDMFGSGGGNTQIRLLKAWAELGRIGAGQTDSLFMNVDTFPNTIDYWGPSGMVFLRNPQVRYTPLDRDGSKVAFSIEAPNAAIDTGKVSDVDPTLGVEGWTRWPDLVGKYSLDRSWGQFQAAAILRSVGYQTTTSADGNPSGSATGWGVNLNGWLKTFGKDRITAQIVYGHAIASYMNDGGVDLAPDASLQAEAVPSLGWFVYYDHYWSEKWSSSLGFSAHHQDNTAGQQGDAFRQGSYASTNLLWYPAKNVMTGVELLWGKLEQFNGESADDVRIQFSGQYKF